MNIQVKNRFGSGQLYVYVTGLALDNGNQWCLIKSDARTPWYPPNPSAIGTAISENCSIKLGGQGTTTSITIPHLAGARIWFSVDKELTFLLNPGPALVEPSVTNPTDPNFNSNWSFAEFTYSQNNTIYANISYVDFVAFPIALHLTQPNGQTQQVLGLKPTGVSQIAAGLKDQSLPYAADWEKCIVMQQNGTQVLRILSPNAAMNLKAADSLFNGYYDDYVNRVWQCYTNTPLMVDTHAEWGTVTAYNVNGVLVFPGLATFDKPNSKDIFSCSSGPFANNAGITGPLTARISAGLNRSSLLQPGVHPDGEYVDQFYTDPITNHYSRLVHTANIDGRGYAFPYDDVPAIGADQSGFVNGEVGQFIVEIG
ncbi:hypothetical protein B0O99DRAFT_650923 [Bisporella sp. PMI_857]|nr:hypothetical protein B0O99DRAFT_650923 [Bisporella sp. PMI_857]